MKKNRNLLLTLMLTACALFIPTGCRSNGSLTPAAQNVMTKAEAVAYTVASAYETQNTATGGALTATILNAGLVATHNTTVQDYTLVDAAGKVVDTAITAKLASAAVAAKTTAQASGLSGAGQQAAVANALSDPNVIAQAAASAPASLQVPVTGS